MISRAPAHFKLQISGAKMKLLKLFEDLEEAGATATVSFSTGATATQKKGGRLPRYLRCLRVSGRGKIQSTATPVFRRETYMKIRSRRLQCNCDHVYKALHPAKSSY